MTTRVREIELPDGTVMSDIDFDREPPIAYLCPDCRCDEDHCLATKHATGTACCDPCEARAKVCPPGRHASFDMDGLTLAMHERGLCGCGGAR